MGGLYNGFNGLWSGATGFALGAGGTFYFLLEDSSGDLLLENNDFLLLETA